MGLIGFCRSGDAYCHFMDHEQFRCRWSLCEFIITTTGCIFLIRWSPQFCIERHFKVSGSRLIGDSAASIWSEARLSANLNRSHPINPNGIDITLMLVLLFICHKPFTMSLRRMRNVMFPHSLRPYMVSHGIKPSPSSGLLPLFKDHQRRIFQIGIE